MTLQPMAKPASTGEQVEAEHSAEIELLQPGKSFLCDLPRFVAP